MLKLLLTCFSSKYAAFQNKVLQSFEPVKHEVRIQYVYLEYWSPGQ